MITNHVGVSSNLSSSFLDKFVELRNSKGSSLCVGLDPAISDQRKIHSIPARVNENENAARLEFCLETLYKTAESAIAVKPNEQYLFGFSLADHVSLTRAAHERRLLCILDCKLGDIADSAQSKLYWVRRAGYDAITVHTQQGNLEQMVTDAHNLKPEIGVFALVLMSNPEAVKYFKKCNYDGEPVYVSIAREVKLYGADGCVVGATGHVTEHEIRSIVNAAGSDKVFLIPGLGAQGGDPEKIFGGGVRNALFNVGRDIMYASNPSEKAHEYRERINDLLENMTSHS